MKGYFLFIFLITALAGCHQADHYFIKSCTNGQVPYRHAHLTFDLKPAYTLPLDDSTVIDPFTPIQYLPWSNSLVVLDHVFQRLLFFNLDRQKTYKVINLKDANLKNVKASAFTYNNADSILLYSRYTHIFYLVDHNGKIYLEKPFIKPASHTSYATNPDPFVATISNMSFDKNGIVTTGFVMGENEQLKADNRLIKINTSFANDESTFSVKYPDIYQFANWGGSYYRVLYTTAYHDGLVVSFPAEHRLALIDRNNNVTYHNGTWRKSFCINAMNMPIDSLYKRDFQHLIEDNYETNFSYRNIIWLPKQKLFVRVLEFPLNKSQLHQKPEVIKQPELLIFDEKFNYLNSYSLPKNYSLNNYFVTNKGIYLLNNANKNENLAQYSLLQITVH